MRRDAALPTVGRAMGIAEQRLQHAARAATPLHGLLAVEGAFGSLGGNPGLLTAIEPWFQAIAEHGLLETLARAAARGLI